MSNEKYQTPKGMHDILPNEQKYWNLLKKSVRHRAREAGYKRITTPVMEDLRVISRAVGEATDIVQKEMFVIERSKQNLVLRPENTAGIVRSYIQHGMGSQPQPIQLYYIEPMFRAERPQKGRFRQFYQYGLEIIGESDPALDAQLIHSAYSIYKDCGIADNIVIQLNSLGDKEDRVKYKQALLDYFAGKERSLTETSKKRLEINPLRILDTKDEDEKILVNLAPKISEYLSKDAKAYHDLVKEYLDELGVPYVENDNLVRGLDYYNRTVFEFTSKDDASYAFGGGGRYDGLVEELGGTDTPAVGFAAGMERVIDEMKKHCVEVDNKDTIQVFVAQIGARAKKRSLSLLAGIREIGIRAMGSMGKSSISSQLKYADKFNVEWCLLLGDQEVIDNTIIVKNMRTGMQEIIPQKDLHKVIVEKVGKDNITHLRLEEEVILKKYLNS